jgi:hypothetical protein
MGEDKEHETPKDIIWIKTFEFDFWDITHYE